MQPETIYHIPLLLVLFFGLIAVLCLISIVKSSTRSVPQYTSREPDWSIPSIDDFSDLQSPFHSWDPRIKISSLLIYCFLVISIKKLLIASLLPLIALVAIRISGIPFYKAMYRIFAMAGFLAMFLIIMPLTVPLRAGDAVIMFDPFTSLVFNLRGLQLALLIILKACSIALMMEPLLNTAPFATTIRALTALKLPRMVGQMILLAHRYIFVFLHEAKRMACGMQVRGYRPRTDMNTLRTLGNFLGMLFVRSFDRTQRVYDAMLSRGYTGTFPSYETFSASATDWAKGAFWVMLGVTLVVVDRILL
jgi:cobalt/nickel transport system permease protein